MKSIQTKIVVLIVGVVAVASVIIGGVGIRSIRIAMEEDCVNIMNLTCSEKAQELNTCLGRIEQSVEILSKYAVDNLESIDRLKQDPNYLERYTKDLEEIGHTIAIATDGAVAVYARFNPDITTPLSGFFKIKAEDGSYINYELTDFTQYDPDDTEHVGWYYIPVEKGEPVWMLPYYNRNINVYMISYVIPIYKENQLIGIVGMDIDFDYFTGLVDEIAIYETGHAFITNENFEVIHSRHFEVGTSVRGFADGMESLALAEILSMDTIFDLMQDGKEMRVAFRPLSNEMILAVIAPLEEIASTENQLILEILVSSGMILAAFLIIAAVVTSNLVRPLQELNRAAKEIANGNLEITLESKSKDEIGVLTESLRETARQLKIRSDFISNLAYVDKLTESKNNTAYMQDVALLREEMRNGDCRFAVVVIDVNGLKQINDTMGHDCGNELIIAISNAAAAVYGRDRVYRIGGDEFAVIMRDIDMDRCKELEKEFESMLKTYRGRVAPVAAVGSAVYDRASDESYDSVFKRADQKMYQRKLDEKTHGETSTAKVQ